MVYPKVLKGLRFKLKVWHSRLEGASFAQVKEPKTER